MKLCPVCKRELKGEVLYCPFDGQRLDSGAEKDEFIDTLLEDKYRLEEKVGEGGMGTVYRATHIQMETTVAVKILHPHLSSDKIAVERFRREARAAAQIHHPNAVAVTDFGVTKSTGTAYLVMEFLEGEDLRARIREKKQFGYEETFLIINQACSALHTAHSKGIIHRDLKPDNIWLLKSNGQFELVKVLDFGIAKLMAGGDPSNLTQKGMIVGTPYYMSPEQCRGEELDARSDVYSLAVILYEMLAGRVPFDATTPLGVVIKHNTEHPRPLHDLRRDIPEAIERVVLRALEKKRDARQRSVLQLGRELEQALYASGVPLKTLAPKGTGEHAGKYPVESAESQPSAAVGKTSFFNPARFRSRSNKAEPAGSTLALGVDEQPVAADLSDLVHPSGELWADNVPRMRSFPGRIISVAMAAIAKRRRFYTGVAVLLVVLIVVLVANVIRNNGKQAMVNGAPARLLAAISPPGMKLIKGATFKMGTDDVKAQAYWRPVHEVTVNDFYLDLNEVTNEDYFRFVRQKGHEAPPDWVDGQYAAGESQLPIRNVSWYDAKEYAEWEGKRLPTEAEWEYAARWPDDRIYPWGNKWSSRLSNSKEDDRKQPVAVGSYPGGVSYFGIFDMAGNVAEWVDGDFDPYPGCPKEPLIGYKVYRGGSYIFKKEEIVTYARWSELPTARWPYLGFRCAKDAPKQ